MDRAAAIAYLDAAATAEMIAALEQREARRARAANDAGAEALHERLAGQAMAIAELHRESARRDGWDGRTDMRTLRAQEAAAETVRQARRELEALTDTDRTPTANERAGRLASVMTRVPEG